MVPVPHDETRKVIIKKKRRPSKVKSDGNGSRTCTYIHKDIAGERGLMSGTEEQRKTDEKMHRKRADRKLRKK